MKRIKTRMMMALLLYFALLGDVLVFSYSDLGVKSQDWIKYGLQESFSSMEEPWQKIEFLNVVGTKVTIHVITHISDGVEINRTETIDLASSDDFPMILFSMRVYVVPADLEIGDSIYLGGFGNRTIVGETIRTCAGVDRRVIYSNFSQDESGCTFYWDKQTGVVTEATMVFGVAFKAIWVMETNMWSGEFYWWPWVIIIITVTCAMIVSRKNILRRSRRKVNFSKHRLWQHASDNSL